MTTLHYAVVRVDPPEDPKVQVAEFMKTHDKIMALINDISETVQRIDASLAQFGKAIETMQNFKVGEKADTGE